MNWKITQARQHFMAQHALLGDLPAQRAVLEGVVELSEAGVEPDEIFKQAALFSLKNALKENCLPAAKRRGGASKGNQGKEFQIAVFYWGNIEAGEQRASKLASAEFRTTPQAVNKAVKRHGVDARLVALGNLLLQQNDFKAQLDLIDRYGRLAESIESTIHEKVKALHGL